MDINSVSAPIVEFVIVSHAGSLWDGERWSRNDDDALCFMTREAAETELPKAKANEARAYVVSRTYGRLANG